MPKSKSAKSKQKSRGQLKSNRSGSKTNRARSKSAPPKLKTQKTAAKRVRRTGTGKLRIRHAYKSHLLTRKSSARLRRLRRPGFVSSGDRKQLERLVPPTASGG